MDINNKILRIYSSTFSPTSPQAGDIKLGSSNSAYQIYDGSEWQIQTGTDSSQLSELFSKDENYFYINCNTEPDIEFVKKYTDNGWVDITNSRTGQLLKIAADAEAAADGKIKTYSGDYSNVNDIALDPDEGDLFIDTAHQNKLYRYSLVDGGGLEWTEAYDKRLVGEGNGVAFTPQGASNNASVILNKVNGLKIIDNYGSYFQATANKIGFYDSNNNAKMHIDSNGNAIFAGKITAAEFNTTGNSLSFNGGAIKATSNGLSISKAVIEEDCVINGEIFIGYISDSGSERYISMDPSSSSVIYCSYKVIDEQKGIINLMTGNTAQYGGYTLAIRGRKNDDLKNIFGINIVGDVFVDQFDSPTYRKIAEQIAGTGLSIDNEGKLNVTDMITWTKLADANSNNYGNGDVRIGKIGNHIFVRGGTTVTVGQNITTISSEYRPLTGNVYHLARTQGSGGVGGLVITTEGVLKIDWACYRNSNNDYVSRNEGETVWIDCNFDYFI